MEKADFYELAKRLRDVPAERPLYVPARVLRDLMRAVDEAKLTAEPEADQADQAAE